MQAEIKDLQKKVKEALAHRLPSWDELRDKAERKGDLSFLALEIEGAPLEELRRYGDCVKRQQTPYVGFFLSRDEKGKVPLVCAISGPLVERGWHSRDLLRPVAAAMGGGGGGKNADLCQGSGKDPAKIPEALAEAERQVVAKLT
jgi:alanyl-tRNA synthetase